MTRKVEMLAAYEWTCDGCGRNSFESAIVAEMSPEDRVAQARQMGLMREFDAEIPEELLGEYVTYPENVTCRHCGATFETIDPHAEEGVE